MGKNAILNVGKIDYLHEERFHCLIVKITSCMAEEKVSALLHFLSASCSVLDRLHHSGRGLMLFLPTLETVLLGGSISPGKTVHFMTCESPIVYFCGSFFSLAVQNQQCLQNIRIPEKN